MVLAMFLSGLPQRAGPEQISTLSQSRDPLLFYIELNLLKTNTKPILHHNTMHFSVNTLYLAFPTKNTQPLSTDLWKIKTLTHLQPVYSYEFPLF